jgi:ribosomal protein L32E
MTDEARSREDEHFWKRDQEIIEKIRRRAANDQSAREMGARSGLHDPELIQELAALGFTIETVDLLPLMPLIQVAWIEGGVSVAERQLIINLARARGIVEGSAADRQLSTWLAAPPDAQVFTRSTRLIRAMLASGTPALADLNADNLVTYCEEIAAASGGILGMRKVSAEERSLLSHIATELRSKST